MEFADVEVRLYAHHSDTPENSSNEKIAKKDALLDGMGILVNTSSNTCLILLKEKVML